MHSALFRQSDVADPYCAYAEMLENHPIFYDEVGGIWAVYRYDDCPKVLNYEYAEIPDPNAGIYDQLNLHARQIADNLVRLSNPPRHNMLRPILEHLFKQMQTPDTRKLMEEMFKAYDGNAFDWVEVAGKRLPVLAVLNGYNFDDKEAGQILKHVPALTKIMQANKSSADVDTINQATEVVYLQIEAWIVESAWGRNLLDAHGHDNLPILVANFIGLLIQSYDAGRGILSNTLLQYIRYNSTEASMRQIVIEALRFDPPVHNTRRVLTADFEIGGFKMKSGAHILVVLAAANRDKDQFANANAFDPSRANNATHLTFGSGGHECIARHFMTDFAAEVLTFLNEEYTDIELITENIEYEPLINVRLPKMVEIRLVK